MVAIGPRSAGTDGSHRTQDYITQQLKGFGCPVDPEPFHTPTPLGDMEMKNIVAKIPGTSQDIVLFLTHYDSKRLPNFVGADDSGSSTGVMLELAHLLCARKNALTIWIAFLDGEEAFNPTEWKDPDNTYGSRELAARMALSGDLARTKAVILADMVGGPNLRLQRESNSTGWLTDMIWSTAARLGYGDTFVSSQMAVEDDHDAFLSRHVPAADIIDLDTPRTPGLLAHAARHSRQSQPPKLGQGGPRVGRGGPATRAKVCPPHQRRHASVSPQRISIDSENGRYQVVYGAGVLSRAGAAVASLGANTGVFLLSSPRVARHWRRKLERALRSAGLRHTIIFDDREEAKSISTVERVCRELVRAGADRRAILVAAGGGVVGDVAGFVAAAYLRGVGIVHLPTTLVAQVDSAIGGKTGVNLPEGKNLVGAFYSPRLVLADPASLSTLPPREFRSGVYEVIKYGVIGDQRLFAFLEKSMEALVERDRKSARLRDPSLHSVQGQGCQP